MALVRVSPPLEDETSESESLSPWWQGIRWAEEDSVTSDTASDTTGAGARKPMLSAYSLAASQREEEEDEDEEVAPRSAAEDKAEDDEELELEL